MLSHPGFHIVAPRLRFRVNLKQIKRYPHCQKDRPCSDIIEGIDRTDHRCTAIGDLPMICTDHRGKAFRLTIHNVRIVPSLNISLLSVGQLWKDDRIDARFADSNEAIVLQQYDPSQSPEVRFKFTQDNGLFRWKVLSVARGLSARQQKAQALSAHDSAGKDDAIRSSVSKSFLDKLPVQQAAEIMNRRLHLGRDRLRALVDLTADAPKRLGAAGSPLREHWTEANAPHLAHPGEGYTPSHAGRLVHGDIVGPFRTSHHGQFKWALILVDDHTRFKMAYAMRAKSDAPMYVRRFLAAFKAFGSIGKTQAMSIIGSLHTDNAGEFLSHEFSELMDDELIHHTTCPPHVHQLNGVAERAIRSIMEVLRTDLVASNSPTGFWPYALQHAVNILNRTTGPPLNDSLTSSFEMLTGSKPKVLSIMPFGCRTFAVKPRSFYSKTEIDARAWTGINLGANSSSPGAYNIWLPAEGKMLNSSDVLFDESLFPWRPKGDQRVGPPIAIPAPTDDQTGADVLHSEPEYESPSRSAPTSLADAYAQASRGGANARRSRKILILFSGAYRRPDGLAAFLAQFNLEAVLVDNDTQKGGGYNHDVLNDNFYESLLRRISDGEFLAIMAAPPCSTFSIARFIHSPDSPDGGPQILRDRNHIHGLDKLSPGDRRALDVANKITLRTISLLSAAHAVGAEFILENPADRGDRTEPSLFISDEHGPIWQLPELQTLATQCGAATSTFAQCRFSADHQKYTTLMYTAGLAPILHGWNTLRCNHTSHVADAGGKLDTNGWSSRTSAAYPADMNLALARTFASLLQVSALGQLPVPEVAGVEMQIPPTVIPTAETPMPPAPVQAPHAPSRSPRGSP